MMGGTTSRWFPPEDSSRLLAGEVRGSARRVRVSEPEHQGGEAVGRQDDRRELVPQQGGNPRCGLQRVLGSYWRLGTPRRFKCLCMWTVQAEECEQRIIMRE